ncbi:hypothetical protein ABFX02_10G133700 [Erythranthe guttata]
MMRVIVFVAVIASSLISMASARDGTATFYTEYLPSACYGYEGQGTLIAAANPRLYNNGAACGRTYKVRCTVDLCPGCGNYQLDLSKQVFSRIANPDAGRIRIDYTRSL